MNRSKMLFAAAFSALLILSAPVRPGALGTAEAAAQSPAGGEAHMLTDAVRAGLKGVFGERTPEGSVFGAVVVLENLAGKVTRVPDYELRVRAEDGTVYTLVPSLDNARSLQPKGKAELGYLLQLDRAEPLKAAALEWVEIDDYVYPRKEKTLLVMNMEDQLREESQASGSAALLKWGDSFRLEEAPGIVLTPAAVEERAAEQGRIFAVTVKAVNETSEKRYIPEIAAVLVEGRTLHTGTVAEESLLPLQPGEARNLHFVVKTGKDARPVALAVATPVRFVLPSPQGLQGAPQLYEYPLERARFALSAGGGQAAKPADYKYGTPIAFDPLNKLIAADVRVSLMELHLHDNPGDGYQTAIAKFKLQNTGKKPVPLPHFGAELAAPGGETYAGERQQAAPAQLMPGLSHIVSYAFNVPKTETGERYTLRIVDASAAHPHGVTIAALSAEVQREREDNVWNLYPYIVKLNYWTVLPYADTVPVISYSYKMVLDLDIELADDAVVDAGFAKLKIELADSQGRTLGSETLPFTGPGRLVSGRQTILFDRIRTEQHQLPLTIRIYETIETPYGEANRLIQTLERKL